MGVTVGLSGQDDHQDQRPPAPAAPCPVCGGRSHALIGDFSFGWWDLAQPDPRRLTYAYEMVSCDVCGHVMADAAAIARDYGDSFIADLYALPQTPERPGADDPAVAAQMAEILTYAELDVQPPRGRVVDYGCGDGALLTVLTRRCGVPADRLLGIDFAPRLDGIPAAAVDLGRMEAAGPLPGDGFDMAFCVQTLEHLVDPRGFLRALRRRAAPGARLYLEVPDHALLDFAAARQVDVLSAQHLHYFCLRTLRLLAESCGWTVTKAHAGGEPGCPRARLLAVAAGVDGVLAATRAVRGEFDALWRDAAAAILAAVDGDARPALWGLGGDFFRLLAASPALTEAVGSGRFDLADSTLAGKQWRGQTIVGAAALAGGGGAVILTPRPQKIYAGMLAAANRLGIASQRLRRPYADA